MIEFIQRVPLFSLLNQTQLEAIAHICSRKTIRANSTLFVEKDPGGEFYMIFSGSVKIYATGTNGEEKIHTMCKTGESFGEMSLIDGKPRSASAKTLEDCTVITITGDRFLGLLREHFDITLGILRELGNRLRDTNQHVYDLTFLDARTRVIENLIKLANKHGLRIGSTTTIKLILNYDEISQMAGVQKTTLMQVIRDLEEKQILQISPSDIKLDLSKLR